MWRMCISWDRLLLIQEAEMISITKKQKNIHFPPVLQLASTYYMNICIYINTHLNKDQRQNPHKKWESQ